MLDCNGYSYEFGGTTDSQQYINNGGTKAYYEWDLNLMKDNNGNLQLSTMFRMLKELLRMSGYAPPIRTT